MRLRLHTRCESSLPVPADPTATCSSEQSTLGIAASGTSWCCRRLMIFSINTQHTKKPLGKIVMNSVRPPPNLVPTTARSMSPSKGTQAGAQALRNTSCTAQPAAKQQLRWPSVRRVRCTWNMKETSFTVVLPHAALDRNDTEAAALRGSMSSIRDGVNSQPSHAAGRDNV